MTLPRGIQAKGTMEILSTWRLETDPELYLRVNKAYGMWGAFLGHAMECRGERLDECATHVGVKRGFVPMTHPTTEAA